MREVMRRAMRVVARAGDALVGRVPSDGSGVEVASELSTQALERLLSNRTCALHVPSYVARETCDAVASWMLETARFQKWEEASTGAVDQTDMFYGIGLPVNAVGESRERCIAYFSEAVRTIQRVRAAGGNRLTPVDKLRLELDELWPEGANLRVDPVFGRKMLVGLGRLMRPDGMVGNSTRDKGIIHVDASPRIGPEHGLFSANVYVRTPERGGELDVWSVAPGRLAATILSGYLDHAFDPENRERTQTILRNRLPPPHTIRVAPGDLVFINAGRPHAVRGFDEGCRITLQSFIEHVRSEPLKLFA